MALITLFIFFYISVWLVTKKILEVKPNSLKYLYGVFVFSVICNFYAVYKYGVLAIDEFDFSVSKIIQLFTYTLVFSICPVLASERTRRSRKVNE